MCYGSYHHQPPDHTMNDLGLSTRKVGGAYIIYHEGEPFVTCTNIESAVRITECLNALSIVQDDELKALGMWLKGIPYKRVVHEGKTKYGYGEVIHGHFETGLPKQVEETLFALEKATT